MQVHDKFSCFIIGGGTLPVQCAEILLNHHHELRGIISPDASVNRWTKERGIPHLDPADNLRAFLSQQPFDYLFSIVNEYILPKEILELPRTCAINYHDSLLPRYAGTHATSWALMHRETTHGVTWHVMNDLVDAGDILKQRRVEIAEGETALTLNAKCYEAAIHSFAELIDNLSCGRISASKQNLDERTFFPQYKRPSGGCVLSWNHCAHDIDAFFRALDFGSYPNPLGLPKLAIEGDFIIVPKIDVLDSVSETPPGTVTEIDRSFLKVSTASREIALRKALTIDGQPLPISDFVARFELHKGYRFRDLDSEMSRRITTFSASSCKHEAFWVERLATLQPIALPYAARNSSDGKPARYVSVPISIPDEVLTFLKNRHQAWSTSDFLLAAYGAYLARIGGACCFDIGFRDYELQRDLAGLEGLFTPHVPLRVDVDYSQSFAEVFYAVRREVELVRRHKTYARDVIARYPVLRSTPELERKHTLPVIIERVEELDRYEAVPGSELTLVVPEDGAECHWVYDAEALDGDSAARMLRQFTIFLRGIAADPDRCIADLPLLTEEERHQLLVEWNNTRADYPNHSCIHHLVESQVERTPDAVAVVFEDEQMTYRELNRRANQLAHYLRRRGVGPEGLVGICIERSLEMAVGLLGILKAGGAYVPLDPTYPAERLTFMLRDAQVPVLLTQQRLVARLPEHGAHVVCLDTDWKSITQESEVNPDSGVMPENLAYVIYTSGSTGKPKGVMITHRGVVNHNVAIAKQYNLQSDDRILQFSSISFDVAVEEIFPSWITGAAVVLRSESMLTSSTDFLRAIERERLTVLNLPTAYWHEWVPELSLSKKSLPETLRLVVVGGEKASPTVFSIWLQSEGSRIPLLNAYGPTETTVTVTVYDPATSPGRREVASGMPIGRPITNTQIYLLDEHLQPVPVGLPGELYIGGDSLARGYLNRPELTATRFIPHPFSSEPNTRLYRTGDVARYLADGNIEYIGRLDHQVKVRGHRIELGEIETVLSQHRAVRESVVLAREDATGDKRLVAYAVARQELTPTASELRSFLREKLPNYMVPAAFVIMEALPLTPNGKVDQRALPAPGQARPEVERVLVAPQDEMELQLIKMWEQVLGIQPLGVRDDFFELGGHSLLAMRLFAQIEQVFGKNLPLATLFQAPTVERLAGILREEGWWAPWRSLVTIQPGGSKPPFFCTHGAGANILYYGILSRRLGTEQPFYGLQARGLDGKEAPYTRVEEMAAHYIKEIRSVQPEGPYYLGGFSSGGTVAFEMAQQLQAQGQEVALLALLDTYFPGRLKYMPSLTFFRSRVYPLVENVERLVENAERHLNDPKRLGPKRYVLARAKGIRWRIKRRIWKIAGKFYPSTSSTENFDSISTTLRRVWEANLQAERDYVPQVYRGRITLFWGTETSITYLHDTRLGWNEVATDGLEVHVVPGNHITLREEPRVIVLAEKLTACLHRAQGLSHANRQEPTPLSPDSHLADLLVEPDYGEHIYN